MSSPPLTDNALLLWLQDEANNDYLDTEAMQEMYDLFTPASADPTNLVQDDDRHHCFLAYHLDEENNAVGTIFHHLSRYPRRMGVTTPYDNNWYIAAGSPVGGQVITYDFPDEFFDVPSDVQVYTPDRIQREIGNNPDSRTVAVISNDDNVGDIEIVTIRNAMWMPNQYAALCIDEGLSPVEIWNRVYGVLLQDGATRACKPLVDFMRAQLWGNVRVNEAFFGRGALRQPPTSRSLIRHRQKVLQHMSPTATPGSGNQLASTTVQSGLSPADFRAIISTIQANQSAPAAPVVSTPSVATAITKRWSVNLDSLLLFTLSATVADLEPVYGAIAEGGRKLEKATVQAGYNNIARAIGAATTAPLTFTKDLTTTITEVLFWSGDLDRIDEGLHEFRTVYQSAAKTSQDQSAIQTYDLLAADGNLSLENVRLFQHVLKAHWPTNYLQLDTTLKVYLNLLTLLLRPTHPIRAAYQTLINTWNGLALQLSERFNSNPAMPAQFLRSMQLRTSVYWQSISRLSLNDARLLPAPNYVDLLNSLLIQTWTAPIIPGYVPSLPPVSGGASGGASLQPAVGGLPLAASPVPAPAPTPAPAPAPAPAERARRVENSSRDPELVAAMTGRVFQIRSLFTDTVRPPRTTDGREICCAYHLNGGCFSDCNRRNTHRALAPADQQILRSFAQDHIVSPNVGSRAPASRATAPAPAPAPA